MRLRDGLRTGRADIATSLRGRDLLQAGVDVAEENLRTLPAEAFANAETHAKLTALVAALDAGTPRDKQTALLQNTSTEDYTELGSTFDPLLGRDHHEQKDPLAVAGHAYLRRTRPRVGRAYIETMAPGFTAAERERRRGERYNTTSTTWTDLEHELGAVGRALTDAGVTSADSTGDTAPSLDDLIGERGQPLEATLRPRLDRLEEAVVERLDRHAHLNKLERKSRALLVMVAAGYTVPELAQMLKVPDATVRGRLYRARMQLRALSEQPRAISDYRKSRDGGAEIVSLKVGAPERSEFSQPHSLKQGTDLAA
jgi:DNA-directed RNA polymerase specialized sigma24 family protein